MASANVRVHVQTGRGRDSDRSRGSPSTRNTSPPPFSPAVAPASTSASAPASAPAPDPAPVPAPVPAPTSAPAPPPPPPYPLRCRRNTPVARPLPQSSIDHGYRYTIAQRVQYLTLIVEGFSPVDIETKTGIKRSIQCYIKKRTYKRGFRPNKDLRILNYYVQDGERSDRLKEISLEIEQRLLNNVEVDRVGREKSSKVLVYESGIS